MAISIDDLDGYLESSQQEVQNINLQILQNANDNEFISDFLKTRGIEDKSKILFEDDNNLIIERNWNDLTKLEKLNILNTPLDTQDNNVQDNQLSNEEIDLLNQIRLSNKSPQEYINSLVPEQQGEQQYHYKVDDLSDDELFVLDLESRVEGLSEDEAAQALQNAKQNEDFYKKQIEGIRKEYKEREDFLILQEQALYELELLENFLKYQTLVIDSINNFKSIGNLDLNLEDDDKEELAEFMLSQDDSGTNYLYQALQDPETLTKVAWFILNGDEAFNSVSDYFTNLIKQVSEAQYKKGFEDGKKGIASRPQVVIKNNTQNRQVSKSYNSIDDLDD